MNRTLIDQRSGFDQPIKKRWKSCAKWETKHGFQDDITTDRHHTKEQAEAVCRALKRDGLGGENAHFPIKTWVEPISDKAE